MPNYKECPKCRIALNPGVPLCYVCGAAQPGYEDASEADLAAYERAEQAKEARPDPHSRTMVAIIIGWFFVFLIITLILLFNQSLLGPGGPR